MKSEIIKEEIVTSGAHKTYWIDTVQGTERSPSPTENFSADTVIIGGGIAGLSIAYCLSRAGKEVVVIEDGFIGSGETGRTTAQLVTALDDRYFHLQKIFGEEEARLIAGSHHSAIQFVEDICRTEKIYCGFKRVDGYLFLHPSDDVEVIDKELMAAVECGLDVTRLPGPVPGMQNQPGPCLVFHNQAQFHPMKYLVGLADAIEKYGGRIFTRTHAAEINSEGIVTDQDIHIKGEHIVVATNSPVNNRYVMHLQQYAYRTYVIAALVEKGKIPAALWWDTGDQNVNSDIPPYHYIRTQGYDNSYDLLIVGGEDHPTGLSEKEHIAEEERYALLEQWTRTRFPIGAIVYKWSGQVMEPMDSIAYIGRNPFDKDNVFIATGDSGNGMTHGTIAGQLITDLIMEKANPLEKIYSPSRNKMLKTGMTFLKEFVGGLAAYLKLNPDHTDTVEVSSVQRGEAKIAELNGKKHGIYRDESGLLHIVAAECTHLKCIVKWNNDEKSWDCPCHGSRFTHDGKVTNGPANTNLEYYSA